MSSTDEGIPSGIPRGGPALSPTDCAAIDALVEGGFDPSRVSAEHRARADRAAALLDGLRGQPVAVNRTLADVTLARVLRVSPMLHGHSAAMTSDDAEALDAWIIGGYDARHVSGSLRERARRHEALASLVTGMPSADVQNLSDRVLSRIEADAERQRVDMSIQFAHERRSRGVRLSDFASVAAVLMVGVAVVWPVLSALRDQSRRAVCLANLGSTGSAMAAYAGSNRDALPIATASLGGGRFWDVGAQTPHSNSANLFTLARDGYVSLASLACPGNPYAPTKVRDPAARDWQSIEEVSYSYQIMFGPSRPRWNSPQSIAVLADRSPVILRMARHEPADPFANAPNHAAAGQHLLFTDGSVQWLRSPVLPNGDNIWLPRGLERRIDEARRGLPPGALSGTETPDDTGDVFLGP
jgi:hypothetical protein